MQECFDYWAQKMDSALLRRYCDEQQNVFSFILHPTDGQYITLTDFGRIHPFGVHPIKN
jgi:hypothetical protein